MSIEPIGPIGGFAPISPIGTMGDIDAAATSTGGVDFGALVSGGLDTVQAMQNKADGLAIEAATGRLQDVHNYLIAANEAGLAVQLTVALRNRAVEAFNEIMRLQA